MKNKKIDSNIRQEIFARIDKGEVKMKSAWNFIAIKWAKIGIWLGSIGIFVSAILSITYFVNVYNPKELSEFKGLGWQIFYEDFPYKWGITGIVSLFFGSLILINIGNNYKKSWQKNLTATILIALIIAVLFLVLANQFQ